MHTPSLLFLRRGPSSMSPSSSSSSSSSSGAPSMHKIELTSSVAATGRGCASCRSGCGTGGAGAGSDMITTGGTSATSSGIDPATGAQLSGLSHSNAHVICICLLQARAGGDRQRTSGGSRFHLLVRTLGGASFLGAIYSGPLCADGGRWALARLRGDELGARAAGELLPLRVA